MPSLATISFDDVSALGDAIRALGADAASMEDAAAEVVRLMYDEFAGDAALVRLYKTHPYGDLPAELQAFAVETAGQRLADEVRCLTLLATAGDLPEWNDRRLSVGHRAIPLPSEQMVLRLPMIAQLFEQLGVDLGAVLRPDEAAARELARRTYDVFHVEDALSSPYVPAKDFVERHEIRSAVGFGGMLHSGDFYAVVVFSTVHVSKAAADGLKMLALAVRIPLMRFLLRNVVFAQR